LKRVKELTSRENTRFIFYFGFYFCFLEKKGKISSNNWAFLLSFGGFSF